MMGSTGNEAKMEKDFSALVDVQLSEAEKLAKVLI
jgi:hypothetical protein